MNDSHRILAIVPMLFLASCTATVELTTDPVTVAVHQRESAAIPGSDGKVRVHLDDITGGQVMLWVTGGGGEQIVEPRSVQPGDVLEVPIPGKKGKAEKPLYLKMSGMTNYLVGDDFAELTFSRSVLLREDFGPNYVASNGTGPITMDGVEYAYVADTARQKQVIDGFKQLQVGMTRRGVRKYMGAPDRAQASYGKKIGDFHGWAYTYVIRDRDLNSANMKDEMIEVFFDPKGMLEWATPSNLPGLGDVGGVGGNAQTDSTE